MKFVKVNGCCTPPDTELDEAEDLIEDMWLGVSVASQKQPAGPILVSLSNQGPSHKLSNHGSQLSNQ